VGPIKVKMPFPSPKPTNNVTRLNGYILSQFDLSELIQIMKLQCSTDWSNISKSNPKFTRAGQ